MTDILVTKLIDTIVDRLDIPRSYYQKAAARHRSLAWIIHEVSSQKSKDALKG